MFDRLKLPGLGEHRDADLHAQLDTRAEFNAKLLGELRGTLAVQVDQMAALLGKLDTLIARTATGAVVTREASYLSTGTAGSTQRFDLDVPAGCWLLERIVALAVVDDGTAGTNRAGIRGLFGRQVLYTSGTGQVVELNIPITTRPLELVEDDGSTSGQLNTIVFVLRQQAY